MKKFLTVSLFLSTSVLFGGVKLTIYNQGIGLVNETRMVHVLPDTSILEIKGVAQKIDPTSVRIEIPNTKILEENYEYDLATVDKLLSKLRGKSIDVILKGGTVLTGELIYSDPSILILKQQERAILIKHNNILQINMNSLPSDILTIPTIVLKTVSQDSGTKEMKLSYLTDGLNWTAEYIGIINGDSLNFSAWISIDNQSGADFNNAKVMLVAGQIHRVTSKRQVYGPAMKMAGMPENVGGPPVTSGKMFEYHTYTIDFPTTLKNNEKKQINFISDKKVKFEKIYQFDGHGENVKVILKFKNSKTQGLGIALPEGRVKVFKVGANGAKEFLGEDKISHTPVKSDVNLYIGDAFDIKAKRTILKRYKLSEREQEEDIKVVINNFKDKDVTVHVIDHFYGFWEIVQSTHPPQLKDAYTVEFVVPVKAHDKTELVYRVRQTW